MACKHTLEKLHPFPRILCIGDLTTSPVVEGIMISRCYALWKVEE